MENFIDHTQTLDGPPTVPACRPPSSLREPRRVSPGEAFLCVATERQRRQVVEAADYGENITMKASLIVVGLALASITFVMSANASEEATSAVAQREAKAEQSVDCSKETWPNFSAPCLRNANPKVEVRLVTGARR